MLALENKWVLQKKQETCKCQFVHPIEQTGPRKTKMKIQIKMQRQMKMGFEM